MSKIKDLTVDGLEYLIERKMLEFCSAPYTDKIPSNIRTGLFLPVTTLDTTL
jgi:hypothetical protein